MKLKNEFERIRRVEIITFYVKNINFDRDENEKRSRLKVFK